MTTDELRNLANLSHIAVSDETLEAMRPDFETILGYVDQLGDVSVPETGQQDYMVTNQFRKDAATSTADTEALLDQSPARHDRFVKVQKIISSGDE